MSKNSNKLFSLAVVISLLISCLVPLHAGAEEISWRPAKGDSITAGEEIIPGLCAMTDLEGKSTNQTIHDITFTGYASNASENGTWNEDTGMASGTALKFTAPADGTLNVYICDFQNKEAFIMEEGPKAQAEENALAYAPKSADKINILLSCAVEAGKTYYAYGAGTKSRFMGVDFIEGSMPPDTTPTPTATATATVTATAIATATATVTATATATATAASTATPTVKPTADVTATPAPADKDAKKAQADADALKLKVLSQTAVYFDIELDQTGSINGSEITWESSNERYISIQMISSVKRGYTGVVTRPTQEECGENGGVDVTLTATVTYNGKSVKKEFPVSVRQMNPMYYNDFEGDVGMPAEDGYETISDTAKSVTGETFRGIRISTLKESRSFASFGHGDKDTEQYFDKRIMSTDKKYAKPASSEADEENFAFYYSEHTPYGGSTTYNPLWITLTDPKTGLAPEGIVMLSMDIYIIEGEQKFNMGFGTSKASQMCRFVLNNGNNNTSLGYKGAGSLRYCSGEANTDFMGSNKNYRCPQEKWTKAVLVANTSTHTWDFYFDGMQIATGLNFRNAEDILPTIEFTMDRSYNGGKYLIDNIYVENMTDDYNEMYWKDFGIANLPYDEAEDAYTADSRFLLQYSGTEGLTGCNFNWKSSDDKVLSIQPVRVPVDELLEYGYTQEQINTYKAQGLEQVSLIVAEPGDVTKDTQVTVTAMLSVGDSVWKKEFTVLVKANSSASSGELREDLDAITEVWDGMIVTKNLTLPTTGKIHGSKIAWRSSNEKIISAEGKVQRPVYSKGDAEIVLTAVASEGDAAVLESDGTEYKKFTVTVKCQDQVKGGGGSSGGGGGAPVVSVDYGNVAATPLPEPTAKPQEDTFKDLQEVPWAADAVNALYKKGIVSGYGDGTFGASDAVTREQFVKMLLCTLGIEPGGTAAFEDVQKDTWYAPYIASAVEKGIVNGINETQFGIGETITRQDIAVMCERALVFIGRQPKESRQAFTDSGQIADYAVDAVASMTGAGYLKGDETGAFRPADSATRAETAVVLYRIMVD